MEELERLKRDALTAELEVQQATLADPNALEAAGMRIREELESGALGANLDIVTASYGSGADDTRSKRARLARGACWRSRGDASWIGIRLLVSPPGDLAGITSAGLWAVWLIWAVVFPWILEYCQSDVKLW